MPAPTVQQLLDFEAAHADGRGDVEGDIRHTLGIPPARYFQLLMRAAATIEGQAHDAITAHRILRRAAAIA
ncbi:DUF3263 domain-containing protein [uncultured Microbacterium sp.]|uniref:DUF3263 domain-containing protein n=1 Tax=uncultured Microbacterium sp. TaxID=191216 RepID=UPI0026013EF3|nr:DUF3263 domain-containing protein [uncultured Microbacterium sp.]